MSEERTGFPSVDRPWLRYYMPGAENKVSDIPSNKIVWDIIEERLRKYIDIPAIEYFGRKISRQEFIDNVYLWARALNNLGVRENEIVAYYGPFMPDICFMTFALNLLGACPYFLKLAISKDALMEETKDCRIAVVFDQMWENVKDEFSKERFETVIVARVTDAMPPPKKQLVKCLTGIKSKVRIPREKKYISIQQAKEMGESCLEEVSAKIVPERNAFITSSSGTTIGGVVKGVVATNEAAIAQLYMAEASGCQYFPGERCLNHFPPTAATSLNILFFLPLYRGMTIVMDPRVSEKDFFRQITKYHVSVACSTGSAWEAFFNRIDREGNIGKYDFSHAKAWVIGGEGTDCKHFKKWQQQMKEAKSDRGVVSAYGCSEAFASACSEWVDARYDFRKIVMSVGVPFAGIIVGVFDENGHELGYNQRGELWIKSRSMMKEYYNKPELTAKTKVNGWIRTGDLAEIDEHGFVYIWGRVSDAIMISEERKVYLFDLANKIKENECVDDAIVLNKWIQPDTTKLVAHIVWAKGVKEEETKDLIVKLTKNLHEYEPDVDLHLFAVHEGMLPYSPTTLKKDKNKMVEQQDGYFQVNEDEIESISLH